MHEQIIRNGLHLPHFTHPESRHKSFKLHHQPKKQTKIKRPHNNPRPLQQNPILAAFLFKNILDIAKKQVNLWHIKIRIIIKNKVIRIKA